MPVVTLAEIDATSKKAARGHGCPWGMAEEAGKSARWLASHGLRGTEALAVMLAERTACCMQTGTPCALAGGTALSDRAPLIGSEPVDVNVADHPLLVLAQLGRTADALDCAFMLEWSGGTATLARHSLSIQGADLALPMTCRAIEREQNGAPSTPASRPVDAAAWAALTALSHRILVPASDESRAGAGAGTTDND